MTATDFFAAEVWTPRGLVRYHVLFVIRLMTREVHIAGIVPEPGEDWMKQVARNLTDASEGFLRGSRFMIHDRAAVFTEQFRAILKCAGVEPLRLPARSPNLNAFAERFVRSINESCLDQLVLFGESSLRRAISEFVLHYHRERNHQGLENKIIRPDFPEFPKHGTINSRKRIGGLCVTTIEKPRECAPFEFSDSTPCRITTPRGRGFGTCRKLASPDQCA